MNDKHQAVQGYVYESGACLSCHPDGSKGNAFNHGNSNFPLTGAHITLNCQDCHTSGYQGTPTECVACHQENFNNSTNPSHTQLGLSTECATCHTTDPDWQPALFPVHNQYYELLGKHLEIANDSVFLLIMEIILLLLISVSIAMQMITIMQLILIIMRPDSQLLAMIVIQLPVGHQQILIITFIRFPVSTVM